MNDSPMDRAHAIPVIELWGNLLVPLQGDVSDSQAEHLRTDLLQRIRKTEATGLAIDVSGVSVIDSHLCSVLAGLVAASSLMGVTSVLCGLTPETVMTLQAMGIGLDDVDTVLSLEAGLERLGVTPHFIDDDDDDDDAAGVESPGRLQHRNQNERDR